ncbi:helix-turn-helix transcriptional regulator [Maricaulis sp.]|uniref:helix-turn-helix domain-containing protein n=1 Tax=Maricaulis sp. TaxID=1486257 RepID=UPI002611BC1F|nr:helix-turn-helix transcriptional regulator [Maricaulis sp.]
MPVRINLDVVLAQRGVSARDVASKIGLSETQFSLLRRGKVRGVRFETLSKLCFVLECSPGAIIDYEVDEADMYPRED